MKSLLETDDKYICEINVPSFKYLKNEEIELICSSKTQVIFRKGETLTKQGTFASYVLFIIKGLVKKQLENQTNYTLNISLHGENELLGLSSVFQYKKYEYSTIALTETHAFLMESSSLQVVMQKNAQFAYEIIQEYCRENARIYTVLHQQTFQQMHGRLTSSLLYLESYRAGIFSLLSRKEIAAFAGLSMETTIKLLKEFEKEGLIILKEKNILLKNKAKLIEISKL
jgi:CRP/FNR family transcriptional regulator